MLIDTHCHLDAHYFPEGTNEVLARAAAVDVRAFVCIGVGENPEPMRAAVELAERDARVFGTVGIHPHDAKSADDAWVDELAALARHPRVVAIGEIGLDYHYEHSPKDAQLRTFRRLIGVAREAKKPIVVHTREAAEDTLAVLREERASEVGGIIHCFSENLPFAREALDLDFDLSFSGILTFKSAKSVQEVAAWAPADRILVETDSPYLAPVPLRGKRCEPSHVVHTARFLSHLRRVDEAAIAAKTTQNAIRRLRLSGIPQPSSS
jgi:TatD DNase family protein